MAAKKKSTKRIDDRLEKYIGKVLDESKRLGFPENGAVVDGVRQKPLVRLGKPKGTGN